MSHSRHHGHECRFDTPLAVEFVKLPSRAHCEEPECFWMRACADGTPESARGLRDLASHHARALKHRVVIHLAQEVHYVPYGEPLNAGGELVPRDLATAEPLASTDG